MMDFNLEKELGMNFISKFFKENPKRNTLHFVYFKKNFSDLMKDNYPWVFKGSKIANRFAKQNDLKHLDRCVVSVYRNREDTRHPSFTISRSYIHATWKPWKQNPGLLDEDELLHCHRYWTKKKNFKEANEIMDLIKDRNPKYLSDKELLEETAKLLKKFPKAG